MIRLRPAARQDVREIAAYLDEAGGSASVRRRFLVSFEETCRRIEKWPRIGPMVRTKQIFDPPVRQIGMRRFAKYFVFYRETQTGVIVERVLYGMRDLPLILNDVENR